jgi:hypothetical protein
MTFIICALLAHFATLPVMWLLFYFLYNRLKGDTTQYRIWWVAGVVVDVYVDIFWGTLIFLQLPNLNRLFFSARMDDLIKNGSGYRQWLAIQIVGRLLEPFDNTIPKQHKTYGKFIGSWFKINT